MKLVSQIAQVECRDDADPLTSAAASVADRPDHRLLRWGVLGRQSPDTITVESMWAEVKPEPAAPFAAAGTLVERSRSSVDLSGLRHGRAAALVVPTGVGSAMGGFIADAGPFTRVLASQVDTLVVNPNVVNGGDFNPLPPNTVYTDGYTLDAFLMGHVGLRRTALPKIGVINGCEDPQQRHEIVAAVDAVRAIYGIDVAHVIDAGPAASGRVIRTEFGHYVGEVPDASELLIAAHELKALGCDALAVVTDCHEVTAEQWLDHYRDGGPNPVGALEAMISRFITSATGIPCVHAPAYEGEIGVFVERLDPRASGEVASGSGLPCLLLGLAQAGIPCTSGGLWADGLDAVCVPGGAVGGVPALAARERRNTLLAVQDHACTVGLSSDEAGELPGMQTVANAAEAIGWLAARQAGVSWSALRPTRQSVDYRRSAGDS